MENSIDEYYEDDEANYASSQPQDVWDDGAIVNMFQTALEFHADPADPSFQSGIGKGNIAWHCRKPFGAHPPPPPTVETNENIFVSSDDQPATAAVRATVDVKAEKDVNNEEYETIFSRPVAQPHKQSETLLSDRQKRHRKQQLEYQQRQQYQLLQQQQHGDKSPATKMSGQMQQNQQQQQQQRQQQQHQPSNGVHQTQEVTSGVSDISAREAVEDTNSVQVKSSNSGTVVQGQQGQQHEQQQQQQQQYSDQQQAHQRSTAQQQQTQQHQQRAGVSMPGGMPMPGNMPTGLSGMDDDGLSNLLWSWYHAGYNTGRYQAIQQMKSQQR